MIIPADVGTFSTFVSGIYTYITEVMAAGLLEMAPRNAVRCKHVLFIERKRQQDALRTSAQVKHKLAELRRVGQKEGHLIEEMVGEIQALEYVLEERDDL